ncbi:VWD domain-containing protein, partial [Thalassiella azotivora]
MPWSRRSFSVLLGIVLVAALGVTGTRLTPAAATPSPLRQAALAAAAATVACPPNSETTTAASARACVAELERSTRSGLQADCITGPKALSPNGLYHRTECRGGRGVQAEAIAQARAIAQLNARAPYGDPPAAGGVNPNLQWEVRYSSGRIDILSYDRHDTDEPIELIEVKGVWNGGVSAAAAQLTRYVNGFPRGAASRDVERYAFTTPFTDAFRVLEQDCTGSATHRVVRQYTVSSVPASAGVLLINGPYRQVTPCDGDQPTEVPAEEPVPEDLPEEVDDPDHIPPFVWPAPGSDADDDGKDDFWERFLQEHPELGDLPDWPALPEVPVPDTETVVVTAAVVAALAAIVAICVGTAGGCAIPLAAGAAAEAGAISIGTALAALAALTAALIAWNVWGDPHLATFDRRSYDLHAVGEFHLLELPEQDVDVQSRFTPLGSSISMLDRVATEIDGTRVEVGGGKVLVDGEPVALNSGQAVTVGDGGLVARQGSQHLVVWPGEGEPLVMVTQGRNVGFVVPTDTDVRGLLGDADGNPDDDLALRDGTPLPADADRSTLHGRFADSWRVTDEDSHFTYAAGQGTADHTDRSFPETVITLGDFTDEEIAAATQVCADAGVVPGPQFEDCVFDVVVTGDAGYAAESALVTDVLVDTTAHGFDAGTLTEDFEGVVAPNLASTRYVEDPATTRVAGPLFDTPGYRGFVRDVPRHDRVDVAVDLLAYGPVGTDAAVQSVAVSVDGTVVGTARLNGTDTAWDGADGASLTLEDTATTATGEQVHRYALTVPVTHARSSLDLVLTPAGFRGVLGTSLGVDDIGMTLQTPPADVFAVSLPVQIPSGVSGTGTPGSLPTPGSEDAYAFTLAEAADRGLLVAPGSCQRNVVLTIEDAATGEVVARPSACSYGVTDAVPAGDYVLRATGAAADYALLLAAQPDDVDAGTFAVDGDAITITTTEAGQNATATLQGQEGQRIQLQTAGSTYGSGYSTELRWSLVGPDGSVVLSSRGDALVDTTTLPATGAYRFSLDPQGTTTGQITARAWSVPEDVDAGTFAMDGTPVVVAVAAPGQNAVGRFEGAGGQRIQFRTSGNTFGTSYSTEPRWWVRGPDGATVFSGRDDALVDTRTLPAGGTYEFVLDPQGTTTGEITVAGWVVPDDLDAGALTVDGPASTITVGQPGQNATATFDATAGQRIQLQTSGNTFGTSYSTEPVWSVTAPDGTRVASGRDDALVDTTTLPQTGTYRFTLDPQGTTTGALTVQAWSVPEDLQAGQVVLGEDGTVVPVPNRGQNASATFEATEGQRIQLRTSGNTFGTGYSVEPRWTVTGPDGSTLSSGRGDALVDTTTVPATGTYTFVLDPQGTTTGQITVTAWTVAEDLDAGAMALDGDPLTVTTTVPGQNASLTFESTADQRIQLETTQNTYGSGYSVEPRWSLVAPDGSTVTSGRGNALVDSRVLPQAGTYTVVLDPQGTTVGSLSFQAWTVPADADAGAVTIDGPATVVPVTARGQNAFAVLEATQGQRVQLRTAGSTFGSGYSVEPRWSLLAPDGTTVVSGRGDALVDARTLPQTGSYRFVLDPQGTTTGQIGVSVWTVIEDVDAGVLDVDGDPVTITTTVGGQNGWLSLDAVAGQRIQLQTSGNTYGTSYSTEPVWSLRAPDGSTVFSGRDAALVDTRVLPQSGTYRFALDPQGATTGSLAVQVWSVPADLDAGQVLVDGAATIVPVLHRGQNAWTTFEAAAGQRIQLQTSGNTFGTSYSTEPVWSVR